MQANMVDSMNKLRSQLEVSSFIDERPKKYFAYMQDNSVITFMGDKLGTITRITSKHKHNGHMSNEKIYFRVTGINGVKYHAMGFGNGIYCRLYALKG